MSVKRVIYQWIKSCYELVDVEMGRNVLNKEGDNSSIFLLNVLKEEETTSNYKFLRRERALKKILNRCYTYWLEVKDFNLDFWFVLTSDYLIAFFLNEGMYLNWWFTELLKGFNLYLSPRMLVHRLLIEIEYMSTPDIIFKVKEKWNKWSGRHIS